MTRPQSDKSKVAGDGGSGTRETNGAEAANLPRGVGTPHLTDPEPAALMEQAKRDLDEGQVDTDMRSTPGLDAEQKKKLLKKKR
ncbi:MAG: hypothetical protein ABI564_11400 [Ideonella sp.]